MSRCFPFPPPGYEKPRSEDVDLLTKEKDKKKHKREKRDKEKRDGKERKNNGKSKDKHKEKKDRKEKHKEKRRHKDRGREKTSGRQIEERLQGQNENEVLDSHKDCQEVKDSKFTEELAKRYSGDGVTNKASDNVNCSVHTSEGCRSHSSMEKERNNRMEIIVNNINKQQNRNDGSCKYSDQTAQGNKRSKDMSLLAIGITNKYNEKSDERGKSAEKEFDKRNAEENRTLDNYDMDTGNGPKDQRRCNVLGQLLQKGAEKAEWKESNDKQNMAQLIVKCQTNNERLHETFVVAAKHIENSENPKVREADSGMSNHHRCKDREEKKHKKDGDRQKKETENEERSKHKHNRRSKHKHKHKEHDKSKGIQEQHQLRSQCIASIKDDEKYVDGEENLKKRKDQEKSGFFNEIDLRPNKLPRPTENGRKIESCYILAHSPSKLGDTNSNIEEHALDKSKRIINGAVSVDLRSSVLADMSQLDGVYLKAPHPDSDYLETVYGVPKMEAWLEYDNQDWLFHGNFTRLKPKADAITDEMVIVPQVWSEGWKIESADVFALPYVIPY